MHDRLVRPLATGVLLTAAEALVAAPQAAPLPPAAGAALAAPPLVLATPPLTAGGAPQAAAQPAGGWRRLRRCGHQRSRCATRVAIYLWSIYALAH